MFTKIHLALYDILFDIYGELVDYYLDRLNEEWTDHVYYERKIHKCLKKREDILNIMFVLRGLI